MTRIQTASGRWIDAAGPDPLAETLRDAEAARPSAPPPAGPRSKERPGHGLLFGTGRTGSWAAFLLARFGVSLDLLDRDVVEPHNLAAGNCLFGENDIGSFKAPAMQRILRRQAPGVPVRAMQTDVTALSEADLRGLAEGADVALGLVDEGEALLHINRALYPHLPVVYAAGHRGARTGDVVVTRPGGACLQCLLDLDEAGQIHTLARETTHGIDILAIAETCARVALVLLGDPRLGDLREVLDPACNFIYLEYRRSPTNPGGFAPRFLRVRRRAACPVCGAIERTAS